MFTWAGIIFQLLRLLNWMIEEAQKHKWITEGEQRAYAKQLVAITLKMEKRDEIEKEVARLSDAQLDDELHKLEPDS